MKALILQFLDVLQDLSCLIAAEGQSRIKFLHFVGDVALARKLRDDDPLAIAHQGRVNVLVALFALDQSVDVRAALVGKGAAPHIGQMGIRA